MRVLRQLGDKRVFISGTGISLTALLKRRWFRRLPVSKAGQIGYL